MVTIETIDNGYIVTVGIGKGTYFNDVEDVLAFVRSRLKARGDSTLTISSNAIN